LFTPDSKVDIALCLPGPANATVEITGRVLRMTENNLKVGAAVAIGQYTISRSES
jgi:hypothetical protein